MLVTGCPALEYPVKEHLQKVALDRPDNNYVLLTARSS